MIHDLDAIKNEEIPTHALVKIVVSRNAMNEERTFLRTLASLEKWFEQRIQDLFNKQEEREATEDVKAQETAIAKIRKEEKIDDHNGWRFWTSRGPFDEACGRA